MRPIPTKMRKEIAESGVNARCALCGSRSEVQWHHVWIYAGTQINERWAIVGACRPHHNAVGQGNYFKEVFERISLLRATDEDLAKYPKKDWQQIKKHLKI